MSVTSAPIHERRRVLRGEWPARFGVNLLKPQGAVTAEGVNMSRGGMCLRLQEVLEVRSVVRLQLNPEGPGGSRLPRPLECLGRVRWVVQRLDLRSAAPFLYDVGIEFVEPPAGWGRAVTPQARAEGEGKARSVRQKTLAPAVIRRRTFTPALERSLHRPDPWHLIVSVEGVPCFSRRYASERDAMTGWAAFKREQGRGNSKRR